MTISPWVGENRDFKLPSMNTCPLANLGAREYSWTSLRTSHLNPRFGLGSVLRFVSSSLLLFFCALFMSPRLNRVNHKSHALSLSSALRILYFLQHSPWHFHWHLLLKSSFVCLYSVTSFAWQIVAHSFSSNKLRIPLVKYISFY